jgi:membrane protein DedA with SNARE-associated domain
MDTEQGVNLSGELEFQIMTALQTVFDRLGWLGVAGVMAFENATGILPSEIVLGLAGWMLLAAHDAPPAGIFIGGLYAALGSTAGASVTYWLARIGGRPVVDRLARGLRVDPRHIGRAESLFHGWGPGLVLMGRLLPGVRTWITIPAGLAGMPYLLFFCLTLTGSYLWCTLLIAVGYILGHEWGVIGELVQQATPWTVAVLLVLGVMVWLVRRGVRLRLSAGAPRLTGDEAESTGD